MSFMCNYFAVDNFNVSFNTTSSPIKIVSSFRLQCLFLGYSVLGMRLHRFYVSQPLGEEVVIDDVSLIKQWSNVFRYTKGDLVILFSGEGSDVTYSFTSLSSKNASLLVQKRIPSYMPPKKVTLYLSLIKKDNFELVTQKATELGISNIVPILSERSEKKNINLERLKKVVIESSEQSGRGDIPTLSPITTLPQVLKNKLPHEISYVFDISGKSFHKQKKGRSTIGLFIGPEGGWSDKEMQAFEDAGVICASLGQTTLRAETAAIVSVAYTLEQAS